MPKTSAGIMAYRRREQPEVFLVHPGGPFYIRKDEGVWTIPKGEFSDSEDALAAAIREFEEETGILPEGNFYAVSPFKQKGGKVIHAWFVELDFDASSVRSNTFELEWPPRSGKKKVFPEIDKGEWFTLENARKKILPSQEILLTTLEAHLQV